MRTKNIWTTTKNISIQFCNLFNILKIKLLKYKSDILEARRIIPLSRGSLKPSQRDPIYFSALIHHMFFCVIFIFTRDPRVTYSLVGSWAYFLRWRIDAIIGVRTPAYLNYTIKLINITNHCAVLP